MRDRPTTQSTVSPSTASVPELHDVSERVVCAISDLYADYISNYPEKDSVELSCSKDFFEMNLSLMSGGAGSEVDLLANKGFLEKPYHEGDRELYFPTEKGEEAFESVREYRLEDEDMSQAMDWLEADYSQVDDVRDFSNLPI